MDRNLGATQIASSSADTSAYGDLYQWGRTSDGHQCRNSATSANLSSVDQAGHGDFILTTASPNDWRSAPNNSLWQGVSGINNPCPTGYRIPTSAEWNNELLSWTGTGAGEAFASPLKLPVAGRRGFGSGAINNVGVIGSYWSSTVNNANAEVLYFNASGTSINSSARAIGSSVRCIQD